jgi:hypothetical protein
MEDTIDLDSVCEQTEIIKLADRITTKKTMGRPPKAKTMEGRRQAKVLEAYRQKVYRLTSRLLQAQAIKAMGQQFLFKIDNVSKKPILVEDPNEIADYIENLHGNPGIIDESYYFISVKDPDIMAIENMLNRAFGRPKEEKGEGDGSPNAVFKQFETMLENGKMTISNKTLEVYNKEYGEDDEEKVSLDPGTEDEVSDSQEEVEG